MSRLTEVVRFRVSKEELDHLCRMAGFNRRSISNQLRAIVLDAIAQHEEDRRYSHELADAIERLAPRAETGS